MVIPHKIIFQWNNQLDELFDQQWRKIDSNPLVSNNGLISYVSKHYLYKKMLITKVLSAK